MWTSGKEIIELRTILSLCYNEGSGMLKTMKNLVSASGAHGVHGLSLYLASLRMIYPECSQAMHNCDCHRTADNLTGPPSTNDDIMGSLVVESGSACGTRVLSVAS